MAAVLNRASRYFKINRVLRFNVCAKSTKPGSTVDLNELEHFKKLNSIWWDINGALKPLHTLNDIRIPFIINGLNSDFTNPEDNPFPLKGKTLLDVGCGGGILTEGLARKGSQIVGVDASVSLIATAIAHAKLDPSLPNLSYQNTTIEEYALKNAEKYDAVIVSEVIEHVTEKEEFLKTCIACLKPGGSIYITTFSKTFWSWFIFVLIMELICNQIPRGTHHWNKFISHEDTSSILKKYNCLTETVKGYNINVFNMKWFWVSNKLFCYALKATKK